MWQRRFIPEICLGEIDAGALYMKDKIICGLLLCFVIISVLVLACQTPEQTFAVSETVRGWVSKIGYTRGALEFRSDVHLVEYFVVGVALASFAIAMKWRPWIAGIAGCCFGLMEETIKIFLPTREFGPVDLIKDFVGIWVAVILVEGTKKLWTYCKGK